MDDSLPMVEMELREIQIFQIEQQPWQRVLLEERGGRKRELPIYIGDAEAIFLEMAVKRTAVPRPLAHDLIQNLLHSLGATLLRVEVVDLREETFFGRLIVRNSDGMVVDIDSRPSDALILAMKSGVPIFVAEKVIDSVLDRGNRDEPSGGKSPGQGSGPAEPEANDEDDQ